MSPARSKRQAALPQKRERADLYRAIGVAAAIVIVTVILVWLLRPGPPGVPGTGGLMNRQPRSSWLVGVTIGVAGVAIWWILTRAGRRTKERAKVILPIVLGAILLVAVITGILWPGGLLRHDVAPPPEPDQTPVTTTTPSNPTTTLPSASSTTASPTTAASASTSTTASP